MKFDLTKLPPSLAKRIQDQMRREDAGKVKPEPVNLNKWAAESNAAMDAFYGKPTLHIVIRGIIRGGKNNIIITRTGRRFPRPEWAKWRDDAVQQVKTQLPANWVPIQAHTGVILNYYAGDEKRRDMPAIIDAIWHVLEAAGVTTDDFYLWAEQSRRTVDRQNPRAEIIIKQL